MGTGEYTKIRNGILVPCQQWSWKLGLSFPSDSSDNSQLVATAIEDPMEKVLMTSNCKTVRLYCVFCAILSGILMMWLSRGMFLSIASAEETTKVERAKANAQKNKERYQFREDHDPDGLGKFYMGREIAHVMGYVAANWLERSNREEEEKLSLLVRELKLKPGMVVADIGAGSGVISLMMAREVGETGKVIAVDIQQDMLDLLSDKILNKDIKNVELVLATEMSSNLKPESVDLAIMVDVYHEFAYPYETMLDLSKAIKPGGRVAFVEYRREDPKVLIKPVHKMSEAQVKKEINQPEFGLTWKETIKSLPRQHIVVFEKQDTK